MRETHETWLDDICRVANTYKIVPNKVIKIYNKVHDKPYFSTVKHGLTITERYIKMNYPLRKSELHFDYTTYHEFTSKDII